MIIEIIAAIAVLALIASRLMAAEDTGMVVPTNCVYAGGADPEYVYLVADAAITPGDNVEPGGSAARVKACDNSAEEFIGTADKNDNAVLTGDETAMTHDWAAGEVVAVITGACQVRKISEGSVATGKIVRPGTTAGTSCLADATSTAKYTIGRSISADVLTANPFIMRQW